MTLTVCQDKNFEKFRIIIPSLEKKEAVDLVIKATGPSSLSDPTDIATLFLMSAWAGHLEMCKYLLEQRKVAIDAQNSRKENALHLAAEGNHFEVIKYLVPKIKEGNKGEMITAKNSKDLAPSDFASDVGIKTYFREEAERLSVNPLTTVSPSRNGAFDLLRKALESARVQRGQRGGASRN